jgi:hypothetical protein
MFSLSAFLHAATPLWTFTPLTPTSISIPANKTATIQYQVTNQSKISHRLVMTPITGITQTTTGAGICSNPFTLPSRGSSCTLSLQVNGNQLTQSITDGPIVCEHGSPLQCYRPSASNILNINVLKSVYTIGGTVSGLPTGASVTLQNNRTDDLTVTADGGFTFSTEISEGSPYKVRVSTQPGVIGLVSYTCRVTNGSGIVSGNVTNVVVTCTADETSITSSVTTLNLKAGGISRLITIANTGPGATYITVSPDPALPSGTSISPLSCTLASGSSCVLTVTPGSTPSAIPYQASTPIELTIDGLFPARSNILLVNLNILTYGSLYQGGYVYSIDDSTVNTGSIGGKVVSTTDQAPPAPNGIIWSSNGSPTFRFTFSLDSIPGIAATSTTGSSVPAYTSAETSFNSTYSNTGTYPFPGSGLFSSCNGGTNGACNSANILTLYNTYITNYAIGSRPFELSSGITTTSYYAAGLCKATISGYSDWYLPAICEMGPASNGTGCVVGTQNMVSQLPDLLGSSCTYGANCLDGSYWSSTEWSTDPQQVAWIQTFASGGSSSQQAFYKYIQFGVRCSRALTTS